MTTLPTPENDATAARPILFELAVTHNARLAERDANHVEPFVPKRADGTWADIEFELVDARELPDLGDGVRGTYSEVSKKANELNDMQKRSSGFAVQAFVYFPDIVKAVAA